MNAVKVFFASVLWVVFIYFFGKHIYIMNYILDFISLSSILIIIFGSVGYYWNLHKKNKEKQQKFKEIVFCGMIVFIAAMISFGIIIVPTGYYVY